MFRFLILCLMIFSSPAWAQSRRPDRNVIVQQKCTVTFVVKYNVKSCIIVGERLWPTENGGDYRWDSQPAILLNSQVKDFALIYYLNEADTKHPFGEIGIVDGYHYIGVKVKPDYPGIIFRITHDGGRTWSRFYTPHPDRVNSNYLAYN